MWLDLGSIHQVILMMWEWRSNLQQKVFVTSLLLWPCLVVSGCSRTCVVGICDGSVAKVIVRNNITSVRQILRSPHSLHEQDPHGASDLNSFPFPPRAIDHSFVALRGVEVHTNVDAMKTSPDWQDFAPDFIWHPIQPDVLAPSEDRFQLPLPLGLDPAALVALRSGKAVRLISAFMVNLNFRFPFLDQTKRFRSLEPEADVGRRPLAGS